MEDNDPSVRRHAVSKIDVENSEILIKLIEEDPDHAVRAVAVTKLHPGHQLIYHKVMLDDTHSEVRRKAIKKLRLDRLSQEELSELAIRGQEPLVRKGAVYLLEDELLLKKVALIGEDYKIIELAIEKICNKSYLREIAQQAEFAHGRYSAIYRLDDSDQHFIANLCLNETNIEVQKTCIEMISNLEILATLRIQAPQQLQLYIKDRLRGLN